MAPAPRAARSALRAVILWTRPVTTIASPPPALDVEKYGTAGRPLAEELRAGQPLEFLERAQHADRHVLVRLLDRGRRLGAEEPPFGRAPEIDRLGRGAADVGDDEAGLTIQRHAHQSALGDFDEDLPVDVAAGDEAGGTTPLLDRRRQGRGDGERAGAL